MRGRFPHLRAGCPRRGFLDRLHRSGRWPLFHAVLNGLQLQWVLDQELDSVEPVTDFVRLLFKQDDAQGVV